MCLVDKKKKLTSLATPKMEVDQLDKNMYSFVLFFACDLWSFETQEAIYIC